MKNSKNPFPQNFQKVVNYLDKELNVDVKLGQVTCYMGLGLNRIFIHHNHNLEKNGLFALLHEAGHALQPKQNIGPNYYKSVDEDRFPKKYKLHQFFNEVDAWDRGYQLAQKLNISIDDKDWEKLKEESLITYI